MIQLTEESAKVLLALCDGGVLRGSAAKLAVGKAQAELEEGLAAPKTSPDPLPATLTE